MQEPAYSRHFGADDARAIRDRALPEVPQHVGVQQNVGAPLFVQDEAVSLARIKPLDQALLQNSTVFITHRHFIPRNALVSERQTGNLVGSPDMVRAQVT